MGASETQKKIIGAPFTSRQLVIGGPGTGKTYCLIERLKVLCSIEKLVPGADILVLTFSVAANKEIKSRLGKAVEIGACDESLLYLNIRTFDSFASQMLSSINSEVDFKGSDYEDRIRMAIECLEKDVEARTWIAKYKHVLVDEIQDLVGIRAQLVQRILKNLSGGVSLFGDPAQAIYDYLMSDEPEGPTSVEFLKWVKENIKGLTLNEGLSVNHRVGSNPRLEETALVGRELIFGGKPLAAYRQLYGLFSRLEGCGRLNDPRIPLDPIGRGTAVLCRTNGQVLCLARKLFELSISFNVRLRNEERIIPSWIGRVFFEQDKPFAEKKDFTEAFEDRCDSIPPMSSSEAWMLLKDIEGGRIKNSIDIMKLRHALLYERTPSETPGPRNDDEGLIISTIHRAKGREYDTVVAVMSDSVVSDESEADLESKVLYVALTRAKHRLLRMSEEGSKGFFKINSEDRWIRAYGKKFTGIELGKERDVDPHSFVAMTIHEGDIRDIRDNQSDLWKKVRPFMAARLSLYGYKGAFPLYKIEVNIDDHYVVVGGTSIMFGQSMRNCLGQVQGRQIKSGACPTLIDNIWVREVVTYVGDLGEADVPRPFRTTGLWLGVQLEGIGKCHWV